MFQPMNPFLLESLNSTFLVKHLTFWNTDCFKHGHITKLWIVEYKEKRYVQLWKCFFKGNSHVIFLSFFSFLLNTGWNAWNKLGTAMLKLDVKRSWWRHSAPWCQDPSPFHIVAPPCMAIPLLHFISFVILNNCWNQLVYFLFAFKFLPH